MPIETTKKLKAIHDAEGPDAFNTAATNLLMTVAVLIAKISGRARLDAVLDAVPEVVDQALPQDLMTVMQNAAEAAQKFLN